LQVVVTGLGAVLIDKTGRKPLLLVNSKHKNSLSLNFPLFVKIPFVYHFLIVRSCFILVIRNGTGRRMYIFSSCILSQGIFQTKNPIAFSFGFDNNVKVISLLKQVYEVGVAAVPALAVIGILVWPLVFHSQCLINMNSFSISH